MKLDGAVEWSRTTDLLITNQLFNLTLFDCGLSRAIEQCLQGERPMARKKTPSNQGAVWTTKDFAAIRRLVLVKTGATGKTIAEEIGRSVVALYHKASIEGISLAARPMVRRSAVAKKAKAVAPSKRRRSR